MARRGRTKYDMRCGLIASFLCANCPAAGNHTRVNAEQAALKAACSMKARSNSCRGCVSLGAFGVPDYDIQVQTIATEPPYYCVTFQGRHGDKGLGAEGCAGLHELGFKGQHFFRTLIGASEQTALIVDIGSNIGSHASFPAALGARVLAVEPHPFHARRLFHMAHLNEWNMRVFSGGASDHDGHMNIHILGGGHLVMRDPEAVGEAGEHTERLLPVETTTLDTLLQEEAERRQVVFLKIDTDGHELQTLKGARKWMEEGPGVKYAKIEFVPYALEKGNSGNAGAALELLHLMRSWGFAMYNIIWRGGMEGEFFCVDELQLLHPNDDQAWIERLRRIDTYAGSNILGVNMSHAREMAYDLACLADDP